MSEKKNTKRKYILSPVTARAHVKRDRSEKPLRSVNKPRIIVDLLLDEVPLFLTDVSRSIHFFIFGIKHLIWLQDQYEQMVKCVRELENIDRGKRQRRLRPSVSIMEDPKEWWKYAVRCYLGRNIFKHRFTWMDTIDRAKENIAYVDVWAKVLGKSKKDFVFRPD